VKDTHNREEETKLENEVKVKVETTMPFFLVVSR